jgi:hypothetical protein
MKQLGLATLGYEDTKKELPPPYWSVSTTTAVSGGRPTTTLSQHSIVSYILDYVEQTAVSDKWDFDRTWFDRQPGAAFDNWTLAQTPINTVICPAVPTLDLGSVRINESGAPAEDFPITGRVDYTISTGISPSIIEALAQQGVVTRRPNANGSYHSMLELRGGKPAKLRWVTDGLSNSFMWFETGGRPQIFRFGQPDLDTRTGNPRLTHSGQSGMSWAAYDNWHAINQQGECGTVFTSCTNNEEIYSFHVNGEFYTFGDGSVHFITGDVSQDTFVSLFTRDSGDIVGDDFK